MELGSASSTVLDARGPTGELRADLAAQDVLAGLVGVATVAGAPHQQAQAQRLPDPFMDGCRPRPVAAGR